MPDVSSIAADMEGLAGLPPRHAGTDGERAALDAVRARLSPSAPSRIEPFAGHTAPWPVLGMHGVAAFVSGLLGLWYPGLGALGCLLTSASLVGEGTGRLGLLRLWLPKTPSYNLVVHRACEAPVGTLVISTPLDEPRVHIRRPPWLGRPLAAVFTSTLTLAVLLLLRSLAEPWGRPLQSLYVLGLVGAGVTSAFVFATWRSPRSVRADPGGLAALLELERRLSTDPLEGVDVWLLFTGCGKAHQDGMQAFLSLRGERLKDPLLVLSLEDAGRPPLRAALTEGPLWRQTHLPTGPALVERLRWAGVRIPIVDRPEASDARAAMILGYRAVSLVGGRGAPDPEAAARAVDIVETIARWFAVDLAELGRPDAARERAASGRPMPVSASLIESPDEG